MVSEDVIREIKSRIDLGKTEPSILSDAVGNAIQQVKQISRKLRPAMLERVGLGRALRSMIEEVEDATKMDIQFEINDIDVSLPDDISISVYRLVQEALNNVVAHSDASEATVRIVVGPYDLRLEIRDDGRGFDWEQVSNGKTKGSGVNAMSERVSLLNGGFECETARGKGTTIKATIPISRT